MSTAPTVWETILMPDRQMPVQLALFPELAPSEELASRQPAEAEAEQQPCQPQPNPYQLPLPLFEA